ncbi:MAG: hypothetical protein EYC70_10590 [Planctomycetota bacterium]|nr:MAG: hypothetical protein EYC70_10590 [Planctomycetota bacterium]
MLALAACGGGDPQPAAAAAGTTGNPGAPTGNEPAGLLWQIPDTPWPFRVEIDGVLVEDDVVKGYLDQPWADFYQEKYLTADAPQVAQAEREFWADVPALFEELVRGVIFLREAERRYAQLDPQELEDFRQRMLAEAGAAAMILEKTLGPQGLQAHLERQLRIRKLEAELAAELPPVSDDDVIAEYQRALAAMDPQDQSSQPTFQEAGPVVRAYLEQNRRVAASNAWVDSHRAGVKTMVTRPDGVVIAF